MDPEELNRMVWAEPFVPFRLVFDDGRAFDIRHQRMLRVTRTHAILMTLAKSDEPYGLVSRVDMLGVGLIRSALPLDPTPTPA